MGRHKPLMRDCGERMVPGRERKGERERERDGWMEKKSVKFLK
jgi:hypothetical protein